MQASVEQQVEHNLDHAARHGFYVPPEFLFTDRAQSGRKTRREGIEALKAALDQNVIQAVLVLKLSRLFRKMHQALRFVEEEIDERRCRLISIGDNIDTAQKSARLSLPLQALMDEQQIQTTSDFVRVGQRSQFENGFPPGAYPVGYRRKEVPEAGKTRTGKPRCVPEIDPVGAAFVLRAFDIGRKLACGHGNAVLSYRRYYEMMDLSVPPTRAACGVSQEPAA